MVFCPCGKDIKNNDESIVKFTRGNFSLWYNKYIPINDVNYKVCDASGNDKNFTPYYVERYNEIMKTSDVVRILIKKNRDQDAYLKYLSSKYQVVAIRAKLSSNLIAGIGQAHPAEISMTFDRNTGVPYIPASSIKGVARFAYTLGLIDNVDSTCFDRDKDGEFLVEEMTRIPDVFGGTKKISAKENEILRGSVIFLDAYPETAPELFVDILTPHYTEYYSKDKWPTDNMDPVPVSFLAVKAGTVFTFRAIVLKNNDNVNEEIVKNILEKTIFVEGLGAKTSVGYGRFTPAIGDAISSPQSQNVEVTAEKVVKNYNIGDKLTVTIESVDDGNIKIIMPDGKKTQIGKTHLGEYKNRIKELKKLFKSINVEVTGKMGNGQYSLKFINGNK